MEEFYLLDYLKSNTNTSALRIELLKYELDKRIYYYGNHFKYPQENNNRKSLIQDLIKSLALKYLLLKRIKNFGNKCVLSNAYFSVNIELQKINIDTISPIHTPTKNSAIAGNWKIQRQFNNVNKIIGTGSFNQLLSEETYQEIEFFKSQLTYWFKTSNISSLIVPNDISFYELLNIKIFKELQRPSFIFLHGLPPLYTTCDDNETDYLIVWGEKIKEHYIKIGFDPNKIFVSGHPYYKTNQNLRLRNSLENILILTKSAPGAQRRDKPRITDRGNSILYLYSIQNVLQKKGIKHVRFRIHPSENSDWYLRYIDRNFFKLDNLTLSDSLRQSSLVIGPTSTVFLESLNHGVNYLVYEPNVQQLDLMNYEIVPPFNGSDEKVPVAKTEQELNNFILDKFSVEPSVFNDYIQTPFDISFIKKLI